MFWLTRMATLSELCARLGEAADAEQLYEHLIQHRDRNVVLAYSSFWGRSRESSACSRGRGGGDEAAQTHFETAVRRTREMEAPLLTEELEQRRSSATRRAT